MENIVEYIGYLASAFVIGSFMLKNIKQIRLVNTLGCICFIIYGVINNLPPIWIANLALLIIQLYNIYKLIKEVPAKTSKKN